MHPRGGPVACSNADTPRALRAAHGLRRRMVLVLVVAMCWSLGGKGLAHSLGVMRTGPAGLGAICSTRIGTAGAAFGIASEGLATEVSVRTAGSWGDTDPDQPPPDDAVQRLLRHCAQCWGPMVGLAPRVLLGAELWLRTNLSEVLVPAPERGQRRPGPRMWAWARAPPDRG